MPRAHRSCRLDLHSGPIADVGFLYLRVFAPRVSPRGKRCCLSIVRASPELGTCAGSLSIAVRAEKTVAKTMLSSATTQ